MGTTAPNDNHDTPDGPQDQPGASMGRRLGRGAMWLACRLALLGFVLLFCVVAGEVVFRARPSLSDKPWGVYLRERDGAFFDMAYSRAQAWDPDLTNAQRIAFIGDSFTYGGGVQLGDRFVDRLEMWLNVNPATPCAVDIKTLACSGASTYAELDLLEQVLAERPQLVVLVMCLNDTEDRANWDQLKAWRQQKLPVPPRGVWAALTRRSHFLKWVYYRGQASRCRAGFLAYYRHLYDPEYTGWKRFVEAARTFQARCAAQDVPLVAVIFPLLSHDMHPERYPFRYCHDALRGVWEAEGVPVLDLFDQLQNLSPMRLQVIPGRDPHPSEIAHRLAAEALLEFLVVHGYVPSSCYTPDMTQTHAQDLWKRQFSMDGL